MDKYLERVLVATITLLRRWSRYVFLRYIQFQVSEMSEGFFKRTNHHTRTFSTIPEDELSLYTLYGAHGN